METDRLPLHPNFEVYIPVTVALAHLQEEAALVELSALQGHKDERVRRKAAKYRFRLNEPQTPFRFPPLTGISDQRLDQIRDCLRDRSGSVRELGLRVAAEQADSRLPALLIPLLLDEVHPNRELAYLSLRQNLPRGETELQALLPYLDYNRPPLLCPTPEQEASIADHNQRRSLEDYEVRRNALRCLYFPHGSVLTQARLLEVFDRQHWGLRRELSLAFRYCPDPDGLQASLLERLDQPAALYSLGVFAKPSLKPHFLEFLANPQPAFAEAAATGMLPLLDGTDLPALQGCRDFWREGCFRVRPRSSPESALPTPVWVPHNH